MSTTAVSFGEPSTKKRKLETAVASGYPEDEVPLLRDDTFYFDDGSCVLLIEHTLFNVHRSILSKDNSTFEGMFSLPSCESPEGSSDRNPIHLFGDTVAEFKNFLWALYALPSDLAKIGRPQTTDIFKLMDITHVANKYDFKSTESWALDVVQDYLNYHTSQFDGPDAPRSTTVKDQIMGRTDVENIALLGRLARVAHRCRRTRLLSMTSNILRKSWSLSPRYIYAAMSLADELDISRLRGDVYYEMMKKSVVIAKRGGALREGDVDPDGRLVITSAQQLRILTGYRTLSRMWSDIYTTQGPDFSHQCSSTHLPDNCAMRWKSHWETACREANVTLIDPGDVLAKLKVVQTSFERFTSGDRLYGFGHGFGAQGSWATGPTPYHTNPCSAAVKQKVLDFVKTIERKLPEIFSADFED